jgi:biopolymer transport protein ExbB/TolQ/biopolymer transport protein ExbD
MTGASPTLWQMYGYEWTIGYLWRWTNLWERLVLVGLALILAHVVVILTSVSYRCNLAQRVQGIDVSQAFQRSRRKLIADLNLKVATLKSITSTAPYLGLAGTCVGILGMFRGYVGTRQGAVIMTVFGLDAAFISSATGLLVTVPAIVSYNYLRSRIESLESEVSPTERTGRHSHNAQRFPLTARFSTIPFAFVAAPALAVCMAAFMTFSSFNTPAGLHLALASGHCESDGNDRVVTLRITDAGKLFLNAEQEDWNSLGIRLSQIYSLRVNRTLYLLAEDGVPFQTVAHALDFVGTDHIRVRLVTPKAMNAHCHQLVVTGSSQHASR